MQTCECGVVCTNKYNLERHLLTRSHELNMLCGGGFTVKSSGKYECDVCKYCSSRKDYFRKHILSAKHVAAKNRATHPEECESGGGSSENEMIKPVTLTEVMDMFMKHTEMYMKHQETTQIQNTEMFKSLTNRMMASSSSQPTQNISLEHSQMNAVTTNNHTTNNNTKKKFNLNFFLNEECKNAMNLSDFIQNLVVNMEDLEHICEVGYTQGMSNIITKAMNGTRKTERPIHCSDSKRETMYVRKDDAWQKDANKEECERLIKHIGSKNYKFMSKWCEDNPGYQVSDSPEYEKWYSITRELCNTDPKAMKKLIHHLALATEIEKEEIDKEECK